MRNKDIIVYGSFGFGNAGDEAVPEAVQDMLHELSSNININIVSRFDKPDLHGVIGMGRQDAERLSMLNKFPLLISGGGIIEPTMNSGLFRAAKLIADTKRKSYLFGVSVEPGVRFNLRERWRLARIIRKTGTVYTRDVLSERTLKKLIPWARVETVGDLVLWMRPERTALLASYPLPKRYIACVLAPRWINESSWTNWIVEELAAAAKKLDAAIVFVAMSALHDDDRQQHASIAKEMANLHPEININQIDLMLGPREVCEVLARSILTVSMRLHGCVMAYAQGVPFVCIAYHPKLLGFSETVGLLNCSLPSVAPNQQTSNVYGYAYKDLEFHAGDLLKVIDNAMTNTTKSHLEELKKKSLKILSHSVL